MVAVDTSADHPNVLVVTGSEIEHDSYRDDLRRELLNRASSPVHRGTHHFWITYFVPTTDGGEYDDGDLTTRPRRFRGVIRMGGVPGSTGSDQVARHMRTMLEEVGHHWLVPAGMEFGADGRRTGLATSAEWTAFVNGTSSRLPGLPLLGRSDLHWGSFLQADKSPMDGQWWTERRREGPLTALVNRAWPGEVMSPAGLADVALTTAYSDLDLAIMGKIARRDAYPDNDNKVEWIDPVHLAPLEYRLGVAVAFSRTDIVIFGFDQDHRALGVYRAGSAPGGGRQLASVRPAALAQTTFGVALRVVRRGDDYHFQLKGDASVAAHLHPEPRDVPGGAATASRIPGLFDGLATIPAATTAPDLARWTTVATLRSTTAPQAIGLVVDKWNSFVTGGFFNLEIRKDGATTDTVHRFADVPATLPAGAALSTLGDTPRLDLPSPGAIVRRQGRSVLLITAPYATENAGAIESVEHFGLSTSDDHAPKVLVKAPTGDFAFGTSAAVQRSLAPPWAAGALRDKTVWGHVGSRPVADLVLSDAIREKRLTATGATTFNFAFIVAASKAGDIDDDVVGRIDVMRRYWDRALPGASRGLLKSTSVL